MKFSAIILGLLSTLSVFAQGYGPGNSNYDYSCVFENGLYAKVKANGKAVSLFGQDRVEKKFRVKNVGASLATNNAGAFVSGQMAFMFEGDAGTLFIDYEIKEGERQLAGLSLQASISFKDEASENGICIKNF